MSRHLQFPYNTVHSVSQGFQTDWFPRSDAKPNTSCSKDWHSSESGYTTYAVYREVTIIRRSDVRLSPTQRQTRVKDFSKNERAEGGYGKVPFLRDQIIKLTLVRTRLGRVLLHVACCLRRPSHLSWHWHGIVREFAHAS